MLKPIDLRAQLERNVFAALGEAQAKADHPLTRQETEAIAQAETRKLAAIVEEGRALYCGPPRG